MDALKFTKIVLDGTPYQKKKLADKQMTLQSLRQTLNLSKEVDFIDEGFPISQDDEYCTTINEIMQDNIINLANNKKTVVTSTSTTKEEVAATKTSSSSLPKPSATTSNLKEFFFSHLNEKYFEFSKERLTVKKTFPSTEWTGAICKEIIDHGKNNEFSIMVESSERFFICIGYTTVDTEFDGDDLGFNEMKSSWMCNIANGKFKNGGVSDLYFCDASQLNPQVGVVFTICIDIQNDLIYLKKNNEEIGSKLKLQINNIQKKKLCPCIDILEQNDKITIV